MFSIRQNKMNYSYKTLLFVIALFIGMDAKAQMNIPPGLDFSTFLQTDYEKLNPEEFAKRITAEDLRSYLTKIASDDFQGRETGSPGSDLAADFITGKIKSFGIPPVPATNSYLQPIQFNWTAWNQTEMTLGEQSYRHGWDFIAYPGRNENLEIDYVSEITFLGYGIDDENYSDYQGKNVVGKIIAVLKDEPTNLNGISKITGTSDLSEWSTDWQKKVKAAKANGAKAILIIDNELQKRASETRNQWFGRQVTLGEQPDFEKLCNSIYISSSFAKELFAKYYKKVIKARKKIQKKGKSIEITFPTEFSIRLDKKSSSLKGNNILAYIEGTDPELKEEILVVSAHYDHLGMRGDDIYNGADDNGSGSSTVLEIAQAFADAKKAGIGPRRSVLCMWLTGEEKGLLGSQYYTDLPLFPLEKTVADINVDMVGRVDKKYIDNPEYIYVIGSDRLSTALHAINEGVNDRFTNLTLDYTYNAENDPNRYYYRSDHYNFAKKGIPAIFYFNGTHKDYHRTSDTVDKIQFDKMAKIAQLVFYTAWEITNRTDRIEVDVNSQ